jgi:hypothetical protein
MKRQFAVALGAGVLAICAACNTERKKECDQLISALAPLDDEPLTSASLARLRSAIDAQTLDDQPLHEYASTLKSTLEVLWSTLAVKEEPSPPDGTDDVVKAKIKQAKAARDDVTHYCSE